MSQYDFGTLPASTTSGSQLAEHLRKWRDAVHSSHSSPSGVRPSYVQAGTEWIDTSSTVWKVYRFNGTSDVLVGTMNTSNGVYLPGSTYYNGVIPGVIVHPNGMMDQFGRVPIPTGNGYTTFVDFPHSDYSTGNVLFSLTYVGGLIPGVTFGVTAYNQAGFTLQVAGTITIPFNIDWQARGI